jgi:hypothetical protein
VGISAGILLILVILFVFVFPRKRSNGQTLRHKSKNVSAPFNQQSLSGQRSDSMRQLGSYNNRSGNTIQSGFASPPPTIRKGRPGSSTPLSGRAAAKSNKYQFKENPLLISGKRPGTNMFEPSATKAIFSSDFLSPIPTPHPPVLFVRSGRMSLPHQTDTDKVRNPMYK